MKKQVYNTTLKCSGCVEKVKDGLDSLVKVKWEVDLNVMPRRLIVEAEEDMTDQIKAVLKEQGFEAEKV